MTQRLVHAVEPLSEAIDFSTAPIHIKVGTPPTSFHINGDLLTSNSPFFRTALSKRWLQLQTRPKPLHLPEVNPTTFNIYLNWILTRRLPIGLNKDQTPTEFSAWPLLIDAYALGDFLLDTDFKDALTDAMALTTTPNERGKWLFPHSTFRRRLYENTPPNSQARALLLHTMRRTDPRHITHEDHPDLVRAVVEAHQADWARVQRGYAFAFEKATDLAAAECAFHEHPNGLQNCYRMRLVALREGFGGGDGRVGLGLEVRGKRRDGGVVVRNETRAVDDASTSTVRRV